MLGLLMALALAGADEVQAPRVYDAAFRPLKGAERSYADLGPAGPYYPARAAEAHVNGQAILSCRVVVGGELEGCKAVAETPSDYGFDAAAARLAERKRIFVEGGPAAGETILVRVSFVLGAPAPGR